MARRVPSFLLVAVLLFAWMLFPPRPGEAIQANLSDFEKLTGIKIQYETFTEDQYRGK